MADLLCRIGLHRWGKWSAVVVGTATIKGYTSFGRYVPLVAPEEVTVRVQDRTCERCGLAQHREVPNG
jgi:hypothetical protein